MEPSDWEMAIGRLAASVSRVAPALERLHDRIVQVEKTTGLSHGSLARVERDIEKIEESIHDLDKSLAILADQVGEVRKDIDDSNPRIPLLGVTNGEVKKDSGAVSVHGGRVKFLIPEGWIMIAFKVAVAGGAGGVALRLWQWFTYGK